MLFNMVPFPIFYYPVVLMYPFNPPFLGSWLKECSGEIESWPPFIVTSVVALFDMCMYFVVDADFNFNSTFVLLIANICLANYFSHIFYSGKESKTSELLKEYQGLQILIKMQNYCCREVMTPLTIVWATWIHIFDIQSYQKRTRSTLARIV